MFTTTHGHRELSPDTSRTCREPGVWFLSLKRAESEVYSDCLTPELHVNTENSCRTDDEIRNVLCSSINVASMLRGAEAQMMNPFPSPSNALGVSDIQTGGSQSEL